MNMAPTNTRRRMIQRTYARQGSLSKQRSGIFKKACELYNMCVVKAALTIFSLGGKGFSPNHRSVADVMEWLGHPSKIDAATVPEAEACHERVVHDLNKEYSDLLNELKAEKKKVEKLKQIRSECLGCCWFDEPTNELNFVERVRQQEAMEEVVARIDKYRGKRLAQASAPSAASTSGGAADPEVTNAAGDSSSVGPFGPSVGH